MTPGIPNGQPLEPGQPIVGSGDTSDVAGEAAAPSRSSSINSTSDIPEISSASSSTKSAPKRLGRTRRFVKAILNKHPRIQTFLAGFVAGAGFALVGASMATPAGWALLGVGTAYGLMHIARAAAKSHNADGQKLTAKERAWKAASTAIVFGTGFLAGAFLVPGSTETIQALKGGQVAAYELVGKAFTGGAAAVATPAVLGTAGAGGLLCMGFGAYEGWVSNREAAEDQLAAEEQEHRNQQSWVPTDEEVRDFQPATSNKDDLDFFQV